jgi:hypothetical protein
MWPEKILQDIGPYVLTDDTKVKSAFDRYIKEYKRAQWASNVAKLSAFLDFRDYAEDIWATLLDTFGLSSQKVGQLSIDKLQKVLKSTTDPVTRRSMTLAFLEENALSLKSSLRIHNGPEDFVAFAIDDELVTFFKHAEQIIKFRPLLKASTSAIETVVKDMDAKGLALSLQDVQQYARDLGLKTIWPILAMWRAQQDGRLEDLFYNVPLPRVFGSPSCVRNSIEKTTDLQNLVRPARKGLTMDHVVIAGHGHIAFRGTPESPFQVWPAKTAYLIATLPGITSGRFVWTLCPKTLQATIYKLDSSKGPISILEFEVPQDETEGLPNWIDCQRDQEGSLVFLWGHINAQTGGLTTQNVIALDEESLFSDSKEPEIQFLSEVHKIPNRRVPAMRLDWRDHGNLLSVHHTVQDHMVESPNTLATRTWTHTYEIVFGDHLLMSIATDARPIESVFGGPTEMVLLSPLSSKNALQYWILKGTTYEMKEAYEVPKCPFDHWTSVCVV